MNKKTVGLAALCNAQIFTQRVIAIETRRDSYVVEAVCFLFAQATSE